jgi:hypothetical protein
MIQLPAGKPLKTTEPDGDIQVGCVMEPIVGIAGVVGCAFITTCCDAAEVQPDELVTVKLYVPLKRLLMVVLEPDPLMLPGLIVQFDEGNPLNTTDPVDVLQVG